MDPTVSPEIFNLELSQEPISFEPVSKLTNVFFDEANCQVFAVRSGGITGVVVKGLGKNNSVSFRMDDKGEVNSIKFSPDQKILSIQRSAKSVDFVNFNNDLDGVEYSHVCKGKTTRIWGFAWTSPNEVVFVTDHGIEHYQVIPEKRTLKTLKTYNLSVNWYVYHARSSLLLLSSGSLGNVMHPFVFKPGAIYKLSKFEIDLPKPQKTSLLDRDVSIGAIYNKTCILVLRHQPRLYGSLGAEIVIYSLQKEGPPRKTNVLKLDMSGRFAVNIIDNVIVVHHQSSKTSMLYDTHMSGDTDGFITYHNPIVPPQPIKPFILKMPSVPSHSAPDINQINCELYSPNWVVFQPDIIIDAKLGCLWNVCMNLEPLVTLIKDKGLLIDFLLLRKNAKSVILKVCNDSMNPETQLPIALIAKIFDKLNHICKCHDDGDKLPITVGNMISYVSRHGPVIDQSDMFTHVFSMFEDRRVNPKFAIAVLLEYIKSLTHYQLTVQHYLCKLLISLLVEYKQFYQLHQFVQYNILCDSKQLACLMLSLRNVYPPAHQLAIDMLKRLQNANEEIVEIYLSQKQILPALSFIRSYGNVDALSAPKYLAVALSTGDNSIFYSVYKFFEQRNVRLRGAPHFEPDEHCDTYVKHFDKLFGSSNKSYCPF